VFVAVTPASGVCMVVMSPLGTFPASPATSSSIVTSRVPPLAASAPPVMFRNVRPGTLELSKTSSPTSTV